MRTTQRHWRVAGVLATLLAGSSLAAVAQIKCWTNSEGLRECGNLVPPEYSQQEHREINEQGFVIRKTSRAKTPEELAAERRQAALEAEQQRIAEEAAAKQAALRRDQAALDRVLLDTFTTEDELVQARDDRLAVIDSRLLHTERVIEKLKSTLGKLEDAAAGQELSGKPLADEDHTRIANVERQIIDNYAFIDRGNTEKSIIRDEFDTDLARFRMLKEQ